MCNIKKQRRIFITGTDTDVGKTVASVVLLHLLKKIGYSTASLKPIAAGVEEKMNVNSDVIFLQENTTNKHTYKEINPYLFQEPIAPHIAARNESIDINAATFSPFCISKRLIIFLPFEVLLPSGISYAFST